MEETRKWRSLGKALKEKRRRENDVGKKGGEEKRKREVEKGGFLKEGATERGVRMLGRIACRYDMLGAYLYIFQDRIAASLRSRNS